MRAVPSSPDSWNAIELYLARPLGLAGQCSLFLALGLLLLQYYVLLRGPVVLLGDRKILHTHGPGAARHVYLSPDLQGLRFTLEVPGEWGLTQLPAPGSHYLVGAASWGIVWRRVDISTQPSGTRGLILYHFQLGGSEVPIQIVVYLIALWLLLAIEVRRWRAIERARACRCPACGFRLSYFVGCPECGLGRQEPT